MIRVSAHDPWGGLEVDGGVSCVLFDVFSCMGMDMVLVVRAGLLLPKLLVYGWKG